MRSDCTALLDAIGRAEEVFWVNPEKKPYRDVEQTLAYSDAQIEDAAARLARFAPFLEIKFPDTRKTNGLIESPLQEIAQMKAWLKTQCPDIPEGRLLLKMDSHLAAAGSVKARGGIYEILHHAETLALEHGMIKEGESYARFADPDFREFFSKFSLHVGSTGNLGLSVGVIGAAFGFKTCVHMSADAKQWKKDLLRSRGVEVREYAQDYSAAVAAGRKLAEQDETAYFVDDEKSQDLFLGYAVAAGRLQKQLEAQHITVDGQHPLVVYIPCGVGGAPGGVCYGLKRIFGDNIVCLFVEPTQAPCMLLALGTGKMEDISCADVGLSGKTAADGLAVGRASGLVSRAMEHLLSAEATVEDRALPRYQRALFDSEGIFIEPSACAGFHCYVQLGRALQNGVHADTLHPALANAAHVVWATGGSLVPETERQVMLNVQTSPEDLGGVPRIFQLRASKSVH